jgi:hypothetical protein
MRNVWLNDKRNREVSELENLIEVFMLSNRRFEREEVSICSSQKQSRKIQCPERHPWFLDEFQRTLDVAPQV